MSVLYSVQYPDIYFLIPQLVCTSQLTGPIHIIVKSVAFFIVNNQIIIFCIIYLFMPSTWTLNHWFISRDLTLSPVAILIFLNASTQISQVRNVCAATRHIKKLSTISLSLPLWLNCSSLTSIAIRWRVRLWFEELWEHTHNISPKPFEKFMHQTMKDI